MSNLLSAVKRFLEHCSWRSKWTTLEDKCIAVVGHYKDQDGKPCSIQMGVIPFKELASAYDAANEKQIVYQLKCTGLRACFDGPYEMWSSTVFPSEAEAEKRANTMLEMCCDSSKALDYCTRDSAKVKVIPLEIIKSV